MSASKTKSPFDADITDVYARYVDPGLIELLGMLGYGRVFTRAQDIYLWDDQGRQYIDLLAGYGSLNLGHNHPKIRQRISEFLASSPVNLSHTSPSPLAASLAERLVTLAGPPLQFVLYSNSGTEAVEAGLKIARAATGRPGFLSCEGGFHGKSLTTISIMSDERIRSPFLPLSDHCTTIPFGDIVALEASLKSKQYAAFIVEPIQCEGGIRIPPDGYLRSAQEVCRRTGTAMVLDEVQTGMSRTGELFAFRSEKFVPDILVLAKSLGGGLVPIGATLVAEQIFRKAHSSIGRFDLHDSTFGGNALACTAALETLNVLSEEALAEKSRLLGDRLLTGLREKLSGHPLVRDVRGRGLLVGIELGPSGNGITSRFAPGLTRMVSKHLFGHWASLKLLERGFVCQPASLCLNVLRLEPPLTIGQDEIDTVIEAIGEVFDAYRNLPRLMTDAVIRLTEQYARDGQFR